MRRKQEEIDILNEQIDIECRKTANFLMYALENDKRCFCRVQYIDKKIQVTCLIWSENSEKRDDHSWSIPFDRKDLSETVAVSKKMAELIALYTENRFIAVIETLGAYQLIITNVGINTLNENMTDRAKVWKKRFAKNGDVSDWCTNRIFANGFPQRIIVRRNAIIL